MNAIISHADTDEYDAEIAAQDDADLLDDMDALQLNLVRKLSSIPQCHHRGHATLLKWHAAIIKELTRRGFTMQPQPTVWKTKQRRQVASV